MPKRLKKSEVADFLYPQKDKYGNEIVYKYTLQITNRFKKDVQNCQASGLDLELLRKAIVCLCADGILPKEYKPHRLEGEFSGCMECHIKHFDRLNDHPIGF
jgi:addiction module RelE/StbE family toxin